MGYVDETSKELYGYLPELTRRPDFAQFWEKTKERARGVPLRPGMSRYDFPCAPKVWEISFSGFDTTRIHGWYLEPAEGEKFPCLIHFHGFTGSRGYPADYMQWLAMGVAVLAVDCREQGGVTGSDATFTHGYFQNVNCKGILDPNEYYYRAVYMDCLKAIDFACAQPHVDQSRIILEGGSQGGALTMAVAALDERPFLAMADVPSNSDITRRVEGAYGSFASVTEFLKTYPDATDRALETLSYFDTMNMAEWITCPVLASVGLKDTTCPAKLYFATYNRIRSPKRIEIYPFNAHDGGRGAHNEKKLRFLAEHLGK